jgi:hypothetical protein
MRTSPSVMPALARASGVRRPCVVVAGWVMVVRVSPRLAVIDISRVASISLPCVAALFVRIRTFEFDAQHCAGLRLLARGKFGLRMRSQSREVHPRHLRLTLQPFGQPLSGGTLRVHAHDQCLEPLQEHPGIERRQTRTAGAQHGQQLIAYERARSEHRAPENAALTIEVLGRRVNHQVDTECSSGRCSTGVQKQLSTTEIASSVRPAHRAHACRRFPSADSTASRNKAFACVRRPRRARRPDRPART